MNLAAGTLLQGGAFRVERTLGQGGFAFTYLATEVLLARQVAIKEFFPQECEREGRLVKPVRLSQEIYANALHSFIEEARRLARFRHDGIVAVYSLFEENNTAYMVMERLDGRTVEDKLRQCGPYSLEDALRVVTAVGQALEAVHAAGLLHRDVKPDNIMELTSGRIVLIDFGTAREYLAAQTGPVTAILTPSYAPIEQYTSAGHRGPATDIYALGATLYELLGGVPPPEAVVRVPGEPLPRLPNVPLPVMQALDRSLSLPAEQRWQQVADFLAALSLPLGPVPTVQAARRSRLVGHRGMVKSVALSGEGGLAATGSEDRSVAAWDAGTQMWRAEHGGWVSSVAFSPDGKQVVSGSHDKTVRLWNVSNGSPVARLPTRDAVLCLSFAPDGRRLSAGLQNRYIQHWEAGDERAACGPHPGPVVAVDHSWDGRWLAAAVSTESGIWVWDNGDSQVLTGHARSVKALAFSPMGNVLASGAADGTVRLWEIPTGYVVRTLEKGRGVLALAWSSDGQRLLVGRVGQAVDVYDATCGRLLLSFQAHERDLTSIAVSGDGHLCLTGSADETAILWQLS